MHLEIKLMNIITIIMLITVIHSTMSSITFEKKNAYIVYEFIK